nr:glycerophosphodiester phosphodiesterase family protein [Staphylococcus chromogenes]
MSNFISKFGSASQKRFNCKLFHIKIQTRDQHPYFQKPSPYILSHRGGAFERPEHTILAFDHSAKLGLTGFEIDIRLSKVRHIICISRCRC